MRGSKQQLPAFASNNVPSSKICPQFAPRPSNPAICAYCSFHRTAHSKQGGQLQRQPLARARFTEAQVSEMSSFAERELHWSTRTCDQPDLIAKVDTFCRRISIDVPKFKTWVHNNKRRYQGKPSASPTLLQLMPVEHRHSSSSSAPPPPPQSLLEEHQP
uniref:Uncharacterized protein n=1 Tax=Kalanchoe fedtschenkoi TaxID=63787 RepID=A0A7N0V3I6_KALFE